MSVRNSEMLSWQSKLTVRQPILNISLTLIFNRSDFTEVDSMFQLLRFLCDWGLKSTRRQGLSTQLQPQVSGPYLNVWKLLGRTVSWSLRQLFCLSSSWAANLGCLMERSRSLCFRRLRCWQVLTQGARRSHLEAVSVWHQTKVQFQGTLCLLIFSLKAMICW